jgi:hypothetical protein
MYYSDTWSQAFSIQITKSDTVYLRQHFTSHRFKNGDSILKENTSYISALTSAAQITLDSFLQHFDLAQFDTAYVDDGLQDGVSYGFYIHTDSLEKTVYVYGENAPKELLLFGRWVAALKDEQLQFVEIDTAISFKHADDWLPPPIQVDLRKFTPPKN